MLPHYLIILFLVCTLVSGQKVQFNENSFTYAAKSAGAGQETEESIGGLVDIQQERENYTVGAQVHDTAPDSGLSYNDDGSLSGLQNELEQEKSNKAAAPRQGPIKTILVAAVEFCILLFVLRVAFQISTERGSLPRLASISLAVAFSGTAYGLLTGASPLDPIRLLLGLVILTVLIRQFTGAKQWAMVLKMAVITRLASSTLSGLLVIGLSALDKL